LPEIFEKPGHESLNVNALKKKVEAFELIKKHRSRILLVSHVGTCMTSQSF